MILSENYILTMTIPYTESNKMQKKKDMKFFTIQREKKVLS